jgi:hypothetical protein
MRKWLKKIAGETGGAEIAEAAVRVELAGNQGTRRQIGKDRRRERGVTILITAVAMVVMLAMAALAIDVVTLYVASSEAQKNADAAALAGAKAFVNSGFTSWQLGDPATGAAQTQVCNGSTGLADYQAQAAAQKNSIAGSAPTTVTTSCTFPTAGNPQITVIATRTGLPTFFARIWGAGASSVSATAKAEAYNPSGSTTVPIQVHSVKPWLIANCDPNVKVRPCPPGKTIVDPAANYALNNPAAYIGKPFVFIQAKNPPTPPEPEYYALDLVPQATDCPSSSAAPAGSCNQLGSTAYHDNIACANPALTLSCNDTVNIDPGTATNAMRVKTREGTQCLIHTTDKGNYPPTSCTLDTDPDCFVSGPPGSPVTINGGASNPNPLMRVANISRSDSVVTVPIFDYQTAAANPCPGGVCGGTAIVTGFLQLGIQSIGLPPGGGAAGKIGAVILNASGCDPAAAGNPAVSGGGVSPVPVRLTR